MIQINATAEDINRIQELKDHPHPLFRRKSLILLMKNQNIPHGKISETLGICGNTLCNHLKGYNEKGLEYVIAINSNKPKSKLVSFESVIKEYFDKTPPSTIGQACVEIERLTGVKLKETQMRYQLKKLGVGYRKVCGIPAKANAENQLKFKEEQLEPRLNEAKEGQRTVFFVDAAHFVMGAFLGYLWCLSRVFVRTPSGRQRFNVLGALNAITKELITVTNETYITSIQVCDLMRQIVEQTQGPITLVLDNARYQRCKLVMDLAIDLGIELLFLPPYSPNLNLIERLWKFTKKNSLNSRYYSDFSLFKKGITDFLKNMNESHQEELHSLLSLKFQLFDENKIRKAI